MKLPQKILKLIDRRTLYAEKIAEVEKQLREWCELNNVNYSLFENENGCMLLAEPYVYGLATISFIESEVK